MVKNIFHRILFRANTVLAFVVMYLLSDHLKTMLISCVNSLCKTAKINFLIQINRVSILQTIFKTHDHIALNTDSFCCITAKKKKKKKKAYLLLSIFVLILVKISKNS